MSDVFHIELPGGRVVGIEANSPEEAARGARNILAREKGEKAGKEGGVDNFGRSLARGASFGFADEVAAAGDATVGPILDLILGKLGAGSTNTSTAPTWSERYDANIARERGQDRGYDETSPILSTTGKIVGGVGGAMATLPRALLQTPTLLRAAGAGATVGGVTGFGEGEGGFGERAESAGTGAIVGGLLGPAIQLGVDKIASPVASAIATSRPGQAVINNVAKPAGLKVADLLDMLATKRLAGSASAAAPDSGPLPSGLLSDLADTARSVPSGDDVVRRAAGERLATAAQRAKMSPEQIQAGLRDVGPPGMLADVDPQFLSMARMAHTMPGETRSTAPVALNNRAKTYGTQLRGAFEGAEPPPSDFALMGPGQGFQSYLRAVGRRAYGEMDDAGLRQSPELMALYENPYVDKAINAVMAVEKNTRIGRPNAEPSSPVEIMHKVKQKIWDMGFDEATARPGAEASYYRDLGTDFVNTLKRDNPALARADEAYQAAAKLPDFYKAGGGFMRGGMTEQARGSSVAALDDMLGGADPLQILSARSGSTNVAREETGGKIARSIGLARLIDESPDVRTKLVQLYGGDHAQEIFRATQSVLRQQTTRGEVLGGSKTADKLAEVFDGGLDTGNLGVRVTPGGVLPRFYQTLTDVTRRVMAPNESVRNEIGRMTLNSDQVRNMQTIELIDEILRQRARGPTVPASTGGVIGGQLPAAYGP